jgi:hypothetical protein
MLIRRVKFRETQGLLGWFGVQGMYTPLWLGNVLKWPSGKQRRLEHIMMKISVTWQTVGLSNDGNWHIIWCTYWRYMIKTLWCSCSEVAILAYTFHLPQSSANCSWVCTVPVGLAVTVSVYPAALSVTALSVAELSANALSVTALSVVAMSVTTVSSRTVNNCTLSKSCLCFTLHYL